MNPILLGMAQDILNCGLHNIDDVGHMKKKKEKRYVKAMVAELALFQKNQGTDKEARLEAMWQLHSTVRTGVMSTSIEVTAYEKFCEAMAQVLNPGTEASKAVVNARQKQRALGFYKKQRCGFFSDPNHVSIEAGRGAMAAFKFRFTKQLEEIFSAQIAPEVKS